MDGIIITGWCLYQLLMWQLKLSGLHDDITGKDKVIILITQATVKIIIIKMILWVIMSETLHKNNIKIIVVYSHYLKA